MQFFPGQALHRYQSLVWMWSLLPLVVVACALFTVRGYRIEGHALLIDRLLWATRIPLNGLLTVSIEPRAMRGSVRTCGNGGLFSFTGLYWNRNLGHYRAFVTDLNHTVVLRFVTRTVVVSPDRPEEFVRELGVESH